MGYPTCGNYLLVCGSGLARWFGFVGLGIGLTARSLNLNVGG